MHNIVEYHKAAKKALAQTRKAIKGKEVGNSDHKEAAAMHEDAAELAPNPEFKKHHLDKAEWHSNKAAEMGRNLD